VPKARPIGIKLNTLGLSSIRNSLFTDHYSAITSVLVEYLKKTGVNDKDLIIWDRSDEKLGLGYTDPANIDLKTIDLS